MNRILAAALLLLGLGTLCLAVDDRREPALKYTLEINGQKHELVLGKAVTIRGEFKDPAVVLRAASTRQFSYGDVAFEYPASFTWEAEVEGPSEKTWTLSGNDFKIMLFVYSVAMTADDFATAMAQQFKPNDTRVRAVERELGGRKYKGKRMAVKLAGTLLHIEAYALATETGSRLLVLQDNQQAGRPMSAEGERTLKLLARTFRDTAKPD